MSKVGREFPEVKMHQESSEAINRMMARTACAETVEMQKIPNPSAIDPLLQDDVRSAKTKYDQVKDMLDANSVIQHSFIKQS